MSRDASAVTKRVTRALDSFFHVESGNGSGDYRVHSGSGSVYTVTLPEGTCTCPDGQRNPWCKHAYRALFVTGHAPEIEGVRVDANDKDSGDLLADRVDEFARNNPDASAIEVISQLGIDPTHRERIKELLAQ